MTKQEYLDYCLSVEEFFEREGINCLTTIPYDPETDEGSDEPYFTWRRCDCCDGIAGDRYDCEGYNPTTQQVQRIYSVCVDCVYYAEYGHLDDMTMMEVEKDTIADKTVECLVARFL